MLARIDERTSLLQKDVHDIKQVLDSKYVTRDEFDPIKKITYGIVGAVLLSIAAALMALLVKGVGSVPSIPK